MGGKRIRRVRRFTLIAGGLLVLYFGHYLTLHWLIGRNAVHWRTSKFVSDTIFAPIDWFASSSLPTSPYIRATAEWCHAEGAGKQVSWSELFDHWEAARTRNPVSAPQPRQSGNSDA